MTPREGQRDEIRLDKLTLDAIVGLYPEERRTPQMLLTDIVLRLDLTTAARMSDLTRSLDYARVATEITYLLREARFRLLESAALTILTHLLVPVTAMAPRVSSATVALTKPQILGGIAIPTVAMTREPADLTPRTITSAAGGFQLLYEGPEAIVLRSTGPLATKVFQDDNGTGWPFGGPTGDRATPLELANGGLLAVVRSADVK